MTTPTTADPTNTNDEAVRVLAEALPGGELDVRAAAEQMASLMEAALSTTPAQLSTVASGSTPQAALQALTRSLLNPESPDMEATK